MRAKGKSKSRGTKTDVSYANVYAYSSNVPTFLMRSSSRPRPFTLESNIGDPTHLVKRGCKLNVHWFAISPACVPERHHSACFPAVRSARNGPTAKLGPFLLNGTPKDPLEPIKLTEPIFPTTVASPTAQTYSSGWGETRGVAGD